jgi:cytochrome c biogenesis protein CcmG, thiol:disulfide interchange protein DsbE
MKVIPGLLLIGFVLVGCDGVPEQVTIGRRAPDYSAVTLAGDTASLSDLRGRAVLLNVWATWCIPCRAEMPALQEVYEANASRGFELVGVSIDDRNSGPIIERFLADYGVTFTIWHDPDDVISTRFQVIGVPATFVLDREGVVLWRHMGPIEASDPALNEALEKAFASS